MACRQVEGSKQQATSAAEAAAATFFLSLLFYPGYLPFGQGHPHPGWVLPLSAFRTVLNQSVG